MFSLASLTLTSHFCLLYAPAELRLQDRECLETLRSFRRGQAAGLVDEVAERALQFQAFGGERAGGLDRAGVLVPLGVFLHSAFFLLPSSFALPLGFSLAYSTRSQSSNVRWVCCWRDVISIRRRTQGKLIV